jgi:hypothetical protein
MIHPSVFFSSKGDIGKQQPEHLPMGFARKKTNSE